MLEEVLELKLSQNALANMLRRAHQPFMAEKQQVIAYLRQTEMVAIDATGIRIKGLNGYHWVFLSKQAVLHEAPLSRAA